MEEQEKKEFEIPKIDNFEFQLRKPINYAEGGRNVPVNSVKVVAPGEKLCVQAFVLVQMVTTACVKAGVMLRALQKTYDGDAESQKLLTESGSKEITPEVIIKDASESVKVFMSTSDVNLEKAIDEFYKLASAGCVLVGNNPINFVQWQEMSNLDIMDMFFQFVGVFTSPSL